ncbi:MAG: hypothetical protein GEU99_18710 [Luteitalea sp.]|nr:hypothetical protein [Luteitalea sp.]
MPSKLVPIYLFSVCATVIAWAAASEGSQGATQGMPSPPPKVDNREVSTATDGSRRVLRLDEREGDGVAWWPDLVMADGTIEVDIRGRDLTGRSFVGVAFHGVDEKTYDVVYFRPFNFKSADPVRLSHGVQYIAHPTYTWNKLRTERPDEFEHQVSPAPDPNGWFHARIVVKFPEVRVFVDGSEQPSLEVKQLSTRKSGWIGVWVGNGSNGEFANLEVVPAQ